MTILVSFAGVDNKPASLYFLADSRISWGAKYTWDHAQKVFTSNTTSEIFAFCGDVLFPTQTLGQLIQLADRGILFKVNSSPEKRADIYLNEIRKAFGNYPPGVIKESFYIKYGAVHNRVLQCFLLGYELKDDKFFSEELSLPKKSGILTAIGSGKKSFKVIYAQEQQGDWADTTRGVFNAFCKNLEKNKLPSVGGNPQLVSLFPNGKTNIYGVNNNGKNSVLGLDADDFKRTKKIDWRNENFERWDPEKKALLVGAQPQPRPK